MPRVSSPHIHRSCRHGNYHEGGPARLLNTEGTDQLASLVAAMSVELNHTIVRATDPDASAQFLSEVLGLPGPTRFGPFRVVETGNQVSLDFLEAQDAITRPSTMPF